MKNFKIFLCMMLVACFVLAFAACGGEKTEGNTDDTGAKDETTVPVETEDTDETEEVVEDEGFKVTVTDEDGNAVAGVVLQVCKDTCVPSVTDADGIALFNVEITSEHKISVLTLPEGYEYNGDAETYLEDGMTEYNVTVSKVA